MEDTTSGQKKGGNDINEGLITNPTNCQAPALPMETKKELSIPAEALDPRIEFEQYNKAKGVLQTFEYLDAATRKLPEESYAS